MKTHLDPSFYYANDPFGKDRTGSCQIATIVQGKLASQHGSASLASVSRFVSTHLEALAQEAGALSPSAQHLFLARLSNLDRKFNVRNDRYQRLSLIHRVFIYVLFILSFGQKD